MRVIGRGTFDHNLLSQELEYEVDKNGLTRVKYERDGERVGGCSSDPSFFHLGTSTGWSYWSWQGRRVHYAQAGRMVIAQQHARHELSRAHTHMLIGRSSRPSSAWLRRFRLSLVTGLRSPTSVGPPIKSIVDFALKLPRRYQFKALSEAGFNVFALDMIGFGLSEKVCLDL